MRRTIFRIILAVMAVALMFGGPFMTLFGFALFIWAVGPDTIRRVFGSVGAFAQTVAVFLLFWFLFGQAVGFYPVDAFNALLGKGTAAGIFWGREAGTSVVLAILATIVFVKIGRRYAAGHAGLVNAVIVGGFILMVVVFKFPGWVATAPSAPEVEAMLVKGLPLNPSKWGALMEIPCGDDSIPAKESNITLPLQRTVTVIVTAKCNRTVWVQRPEGASRFGMEADGPVNTDLAFPNMKNPYGAFRSGWFLWDPLVFLDDKGKTGVRFAAPSVGLDRKVTFYLQ